MKRRLLSALLAMAMLLTMVPAAFAVDNEPGGENGGDTSKTVSVGKSITLTGTAADGEGVTHTWEITSGKNIITLNKSQENPWEATVTGVAEGTAEVIHSYAYASTPSNPDDDIYLPSSDTSESFTVIVTAEEEPDDKPEVGKDCVAYIVRDTETKEYNDLQIALNEAKDGETIVLCKDLTDVAVTVEKSINSITLDLNDHTISGKQHPTSEGSSSTTPQPENSTPAAITIGSNVTGAGEADQPKVGSFTLKNGTVSVGTGLRLYDDLTTLMVENVTFEGNVASNAKQKEGGAAVNWRASDEAAVTVGGTSATFVNCKFQNNKSEYQVICNANGGAVMLANVEEVTFKDCDFIGNSGKGPDTNYGTGGAVYSDYCGSVTFTDCDFSGNSAASASGGGAVYMQINGTASFTGCKFTENKALAGAGGALTITFAGNEEVPVNISNCTFTKNTAAYGGAMGFGLNYVTKGTYVKLTDNTIKDNSATTYGGAIYATTLANVTLSGDLSNNTAAYGGAVYTQWGYYLLEDLITQRVGIPTVTINGDLTDNHATYGGAVYSNIANTTVNGAVTGNSAANGGGVYMLQNEYGAAYSGPIDLTGASVYNNTATTAAADIYSGADNTLKIGEVGSNWSLNSCGHLIDGWYSDAAGARWVCDTPTTEASMEFTDGTATITEQTALIAAHGTDAKAAQTVTITPADIVIYTGGTGYSGVLANEDGTLLNQPTSGLPEPGYHIDLSPDIENWLKEQGIDTSKATHLDEILHFSYDQDEQQREWGMSYIGVYEADPDTGAATRYVYSLNPAKVGEEEIPVRIMYLDENDEPIESDQIDMTADAASATYTIAVNPDGLKQSKIQAVFTVGEETLTCNVAIGTGDLMVKSVTEEQQVNEIVSDDNEVDNNVITAVADENVKYYVNDSEVAIDNTGEDANRVQLLVDDVSNSEDFNNALGEAATKKVTETVTDLDNVKFAAQYLDLVDTANGNAVVTLGDNQKLSLYWPVPSDAADDSAFRIVHYTDMDRESTTAQEDLGAAKTTVINGTPEKINGRTYIKFETGSFSPFVLVYEGKSSSGGGTTRYTLTYESNGGTEYNSERYTRNTVVELDKVPTREDYTFTGWYADKELTDRITEIKMTSNKTVYAGWEITGIPDWLNGDDHFAYVIGYEDGTVRPESNISRAEVATIFFRLLDPEIREENLTDENTFADVGKGIWYNQAISTMAALGIVNGRTDTAFEPDAPITRAEFAAICARFDTNKRDGDSNFTDISGHWAEAEIERAATLGWINGYEDGTFRPDAEITRAEAMTLINRVLQRLPETADDLLDDMTVWPDCQPNAWYYLAVQEATNSHDFDRKDDGVHESWTALTEAPDWEQYQ